MSFISISNLHTTGSEPFTDDQNNMSEILENEFTSITGGTTKEPELKFTMLSNVLKTRHDTVKNSIGNIF